MTTNEITIGQHVYRVGALSALEQFHIVRRLAPLMARVSTMTAALDAVRHLRAQAPTQEGDTGEVPGEMFAAMVGPILQAAADMPQADADYIILQCLRVCARQQSGGAYAPLVAGDGVTLMFADLQLGDMLQLVKETVARNMGNFFDLVATALL